jgi:hypothetical protein
MTEEKNELRDAIDKHAKMLKIEKHLEDVTLNLDGHYKEYERLLKLVEKKAINIEKLETKSVKSLFHSVLGDKESYLEHEKQDYLQATLEFDKIRSSIDLLEFEENVLKDKIEDITQLKIRIDQLIEAREKEISRMNTQAGVRIRQLHEHLEALETTQRDINEARESGLKAEQPLRQMIKYLRTAGNWGASNYGGGSRRMQTYAKFGNIDAARKLSYVTQLALRRFSHDIEDIYEPQNINFDFEIGGFLDFTDIFLRNLVSDWVLRQRIAEALRGVQSVHHRVKQILSALERDQKSIDRELEQLEKERRQIVLDSV